MAVPRASEPILKPGAGRVSARVLTRPPPPHPPTRGALDGAGEMPGERPRQGGRLECPFCLLVSSRPSLPLATTASEGPLPSSIALITPEA